jgi:hypothetical protein
MMEYKEYASKGVAGAGLGLGIAGTALGLMSGGGALLNLLGGNRAGNAATDMAAAMMMANAAPRTAGCTCSEDHTINRYEASQSARIAELETEVKLRDANIHTDSKILKVYEYFDGRLRGVEGQLAQQAVYNATNNGLIGCLQNQVAALQGMTKTVIPDSNICPQPMQRYNSWTAPTTAAASASTGG